MKSRLKYGLSAILVVVSPTLALSQSVSSSQLSAAAGTAEVTQATAKPVTEAEATAALKKDLLTVAVKEPVEIKEEQAVALELLIADAPAITVQDPDLSIEGVTAEGFTRYVTVDDKKVGQAVITRLKKGPKYADLNPENFTSQFEVDDPQLEPSDVLKVDGNEEELKAALRKLNGIEEEEEEQEEEEHQKEGPSDRQANGGAGSTGPQNEMASAYETPERREQANSEEPVQEYRTTSEGCEPIVDYNQGVVRKQVKTQTIEGGVVVAEDACADSGEFFTIQRSFSVCEDKVDVEGRFANPQFIEYYNDEKGARVELSECQPDPEQRFTIVEEESCAMDIDIDAQLAIVQTALVYRDANNNLKTVRSCQPSETIEPIQMTQDASACPIRHDFAAGQSEEMAMWIYQKDNQFFQATPCMTTGTTFTHKKVFKQNGIDVCNVLVDLPGGQAIPQYRTQIMKDGAPEFIDECKPEESAAIGIHSTIDTCMNPANFNHDIDAGVSYGLERFYYENPGRVYVTKCQQSDVTYTHEQETTSWKNYDSRKVAQALTTVTINVDGTTYPVATNMLMPGTPEVPYQDLGEQVKPEADVKSNYTFEECEGYLKTKRVHSYQRPDETVYAMTMGEGQPLPKGDLCERETERKRVQEKCTGYGCRRGTMVDAWIKDGWPRQKTCSSNSAPVSFYALWDERNKTIYPDGRVETTDWKRVQEFSHVKVITVSQSGSRSSCR